MRLVAAGGAIHYGLAGISTASELARVIPKIIEVGAGALLLLGLWTPVSGALVAVSAFWNLYSAPGDPWTFVLLGAFGAGLAMVGPGAWSIDARLFGRQRIDLRTRE